MMARDLQKWTKVQITKFRNFHLENHKLRINELKSISNKKLAERFVSPKFELRCHTSFKNFWNDRRHLKNSINNISFCEANFNWSILAQKFKYYKWKLPFFLTLFLLEQTPSIRKSWQTCDILLFCSQLTIMDRRILVLLLLLKICN